MGPGLTDPDGDTLVARCGLLGLAIAGRPPFTYPDALVEAQRKMREEFSKELAKLEPQVTS